MDSTDFTHSATRRALSIPELATMILSSECLSRSDLAGLRRVSHQMSNLVAPLLWRNATAEGLLALIESAEFVASWGEPAHLICLDSYASGPNNFEEFHVYAHYIETLEIYHRDSKWCYMVEDWYLLWDELAARGRPLLPNLTALRFMSTSCSHGLQEIEWISVFATSKMKEVSLAPNRYSPSDAWPILFPIASSILQTLVDRCPGIQTLHLAAEDDRFLEGPDAPNAYRRAGLAHEASRPWYQVLPHLKGLQDLTVSEGWLYPDSLEALGKLPELGSLAIVPGKFDDFDYESDMDPYLLDGSFPRLTQLSLLGLQGSGMGVILAVTEMTRQITNMRIEFDYFSANDQPYEFKILFKGLRNVTCLQELHVCYPCDSEKGDYPTEINDWIEKMGVHPSLEHVRIDGFRMPKHFRRAGSIRRLASIWPNVKTLSMPSQHTSLQDLEDFATLPSLVNLTVKLDLSNPYLPEEPDSERAPLETLASSGPVRLSSNYKYFSRSAQALLLLWPSLRRVTWSDEDPARTELAGLFNSEVLQFNREFLFGSPRQVARLSAREAAKKTKVPFKRIMEDLEEVDPYSDTCSEEEGSDTS